MKKEKRLVQSKKCMPNKEKIEISRIHITLTQPTYMIRIEGELEDLKKKFVNVAINHLREAGKKKDCDEDESHELLPQLTINTLEDTSIEYVRRLVEGKSWIIRRSHLLFKSNHLCVLYYVWCVTNNNGLNNVSIAVNLFFKFFL